MDRHTLKHCAGRAGRKTALSVCLLALLGEPTLANPVTTEFFACFYQENASITFEAAEFRSRRELFISEHALPGAGRHFEISDNPASLKTGVAVRENGPTDRSFKVDTPTVYFDWVLKLLTSHRSLVISYTFEDTTLDFTGLSIRPLRPDEDPKCTMAHPT